MTDAEAGTPADRRARDMETLRTYFRLLARRDIDRWITLWSAACTQHMPYAAGGLPDRVEGRDEVHTLYKRLAAGYRSLAYPDTELYPLREPGRILARWFPHGETTDGRTYVNENLGIFAFDPDGRIRHFTEYYNPVGLTGTADHTPPVPAGRPLLAGVGAVGEGSRARADERRAADERTLWDYFRLLRDKDLDSWKELLAPDCSLAVPYASGAVPSALHGRDEIHRLWRAIANGYRRMRYERLEILPLSDPAGFLARWSPVGELVGGGHYRNESVGVFEFGRDGRIQHFTEYFNPAGLAESFALHG
ncbi:nuclear transport factor 2 family protein [Streptomyces polygonati]|uniref:Nuclear transport factor 2 family protein n=1 Tax=Streptomyces polygonati TaxID=1617087 RepID=A0ABV8HG87_9ACTN